VKTPPLHRPLSLIRAACYVGLAEIIACLLFVNLHPLNTEPRSITAEVIAFTILAVPFAFLWASAWLARDNRLVAWLLLLPTSLVLLVMTWGCLGDALLADSALRSKAAGRHTMNCAGTALLYAVPLAYVLSWGALVMGAVSFGVNGWLLRSAVAVK
jgi:hypothetical protein